MNAYWIRLLRWNFASWKHWRLLLPGVGIFIFLGWFSGSQLQAVSHNITGDITLWDVVFLAFSGPGAWDNTILYFLPWASIHLYFLYLTGDLTNRELEDMGYSIVPQVGSRLYWWWGKAITWFFLAGIYIILGLVGVLAGALILTTFSLDLNAPLHLTTYYSTSTILVKELLLWILLLFFTTLAALATLQLVVSVVLRSSTAGFVAVAVIVFLSWILGTGNPSIIPWLPGSQSMLLRHTMFEPDIPNFSIGWSLIYNSALAGILLIASSGYIRVIDIFGKDYHR
jgi:hypothetical protein